MIAPASTGRESKSKIAVIIIDQTKRGIFSIVKFLWCMFKIVEIKLIAPRIDDIPAIWREKIERSIEGPEWKILEAKGG